MEEERTISELEEEIEELQQVLAVERLKQATLAKEEITKQEGERFLEGVYILKTVIPYTEKPVMVTYRFTLEELENHLHDLTCPETGIAEFPVSLEIVHGELAEKSETAKA